MTNPPPRQAVHRRTVIGVAAGAAVLLVLVLLFALTRTGDDRAEPPAAPGSTAATAATPALSASSPSTQSSPSVQSGPASPPPATTSAPPAKAAMPNLVGQNAAAARIALERLGFTTVQFAAENPADEPVILPQNWTVTKQSTPAGTQLTADTTVTLTCTRRV